jgi:putative SOS response-associated peptidase YedK
MCGRFTLRTPASIVAEQFSLFALPQFPARYNIVPSQPVPVVRLGSDPSRPQREFVLLHWGLVPSWAKDAAIGNRLTNARAETAVDKPSFRAAFKRRRCLIVADGFYEWQRITKRPQPFYIHRKDDRPFAMAGLWESWEGAGHDYLESCTIITTEANDLMRPIHDRIPVILDPADYGTWLDPAIENGERITGLLHANDGTDWEAYPVSTAVNNPRNEGPELIERHAPPAAERTLFD